MRHWQMWVSNKTKGLLFLLLIVLLSVSTSCSLAPSAPQATIRSATVQPSEIPSATSTVTPSITPSVTPSITPSATPTIAPTVVAPQFWVENRGVLEQNGYDLVQSTTGWEIQHEGQTVFTDKEAQNIVLVPVSADAGPTVVFTQVDEEGQVEKFYNPHVNPDFGKAEWEDYLDISLDSTNPTEVTIDQVHSGQILMSALIKSGTEQWWENGAPVFTFVTYPSAQHVEGYKSTILPLSPQDENGLVGATSTSRFLGFYETNFSSERIVVGMVQTLISEDGETVTLNAGYSGEILLKMWDDHTPYLQRITFNTAGDEEYKLFRGIDDHLIMNMLGAHNMIGVQRLYEQDPNNQPWKLFPELMTQLEQMEVMDKPLYDFILMDNIKIDKEDLRRLQFMVLYPSDID